MPCAAGGHQAPDKAADKAADNAKAAVNDKADAKEDLRRWFHSEPCVADRTGMPSPASTSLDQAFHSIRAVKRRTSATDEEDVLF